LPRCEVRNCQFIAGASAIFIGPGETKSFTRVALRNNAVVAAGSALWTDFSMMQSPPAPVELRLTRNTFAGGPVTISRLGGGPDLPAQVPIMLHVEETGNVFGGRRFPVSALLFGLKSGDGSAELRQCVEWRGDHNLFAPEAALWLMNKLERWKGKNATPLDDWRQFWNSPETGSAEGSTRFAGGALLRGPNQG